jgi:hypothetical protein
MMMMMTLPPCRRQRAEQRQGPQGPGHRPHPSQGRIRSGDGGWRPTHHPAGAYSANRPCMPHQVIVHILYAAPSHMQQTGLVCHTKSLRIFCMRHRVTDTTMLSAGLHGGYVHVIRPPPLLSSFECGTKSFVSFDAFFVCGTESLTRLCFRQGFMADTSMTYALLRWTPAGAPQGAWAVGWCQ